MTRWHARGQTVAALLCLVLWESGQMIPPRDLAPQGLPMEYRLVYCPGRVYHTSSSFWAHPGRVKVQGRLGGFDWQDVKVADEPGGWAVPEDFWRLAPHTDAKMGGVAP